MPNIGRKKRQENLPIFKKKPNIGRKECKKNLPIFKKAPNIGRKYRQEKPTYIQEKAKYR